jgi:hypothetical protein
MHKQKELRCKRALLRYIKALKTIENNLNKAQYPENWKYKMDYIRIQIQNLNAKGINLNEPAI